MDKFSEIALWVFFAAFCLLAFATPMELGDAWWHMKTGGWIWEHKGLPAADPFSLAPVRPDMKAVLSASWLGQLVMFGSYSLAGIGGVIALKAMLFCVVSLAMERLLKTFGVGSPLRQILILPVVFIGVFYDEIRPQTFSFAFFALVILLLEKRRLDRASRSFYLLPPMMLAWANIHQGFVSGLALILFYCAFDIARKLPSMERLKTLSVAVSSVLLSAISPNGLKPIFTTLGMLKGSASGTASIHEHLPVREFAAMTGDTALFAAIVALIILGAASFFLCLVFKGPKAIDLRHLIMFAGMSGAALITFRAGMFFAIVAVMAVARNISNFKEKISAMPRKVAWISSTVLIVVLAVFASYLLWPRSVFAKPAVDGQLIPVKTADFILSVKPPGNIYHPYEWGGYFIWRLYPDYKVFIDTRALGLVAEYDRVLDAAPGWKDILDRRGVNTFVYWPLLPYRGAVPEILFALMKDDGWQPVYWDLTSIAFMRGEFAKNPMRKDAVWELLGSMVGANISRSPGNPAHYVTLGRIYLVRGLKIDAANAFRKALTLDPGNKEAAFFLSLASDAGGDIN